MSTPASNGRARRQRVSPRARIAVLVSGVWLYGTANRVEFERAVGGNENHPTCRLSKKGWKTGTSVVMVVGSQVGAWEWQAGASTPAKRKRAAKPLPGRELTGAQRNEILALDIDQNTRSMLCLAAGVDSIDALTQASLPAFKEALAGYMEQAER